MSTTSSQIKTALITGASSGIGYELTKLFARDGYHVVLVARSAQRLNQIADELKNQFGISVKVIVKDLSEPSAAIEIFDELQKESTSVAVLVNNAGYTVFAEFTEADLKDQLDMMQINMTTLTQLTHLFLRDMLNKRAGRILNVASTAAFQPGPMMAVYYATKAYVLSFSQAIANELQGTGVTVTALCPGPTETGFQKRGKMEGVRLVSGNLMSAADVARAGYRGLMAGKTIVIPGLYNRLQAEWVRFVPRSIVPRVVRYAHERVH